MRKIGEQLILSPLDKAVAIEIIALESSMTLLLMPKEQPDISINYSLGKIRAT